MSCKTKKIIGRKIFIEDGQNVEFTVKYDNNQYTKYWKNPEYFNELEIFSMWNDYIMNFDIRDGRTIAGCVNEN